MMWLCGYRRLAELESLLQRVEDDSKVTLESVNTRIHEKTAEADTYRMDNDRLKVCPIIHGCFMYLT